jgi:acyl-CoA thioester hydrolase
MDHSKFYNPARYRFWVEDQVRFCDLDVFGHVNNNAIGTYFENARAAFFMSLRPAWPKIDPNFIIVHTSLDFTDELHMPARVKIGCAIVEIGRTSAKMSNALFSGDKPIAHSEITFVLIDQKSRQPVMIPEDLRSDLAPFFVNEA